MCSLPSDCTDASGRSPDPGEALRFGPGILGVLVALAGMALYSRATWAGIAALFLCVLSAIDNFFFIPYYPFWSILLIALNVWIIWALTRPGAIRT